jgi:hypothetical protein
MNCKQGLWFLYTYLQLDADDNSRCRCRILNNYEDHWDQVFHRSSGSVTLLFLCTMKDLTPFFCTMKDLTPFFQ